MDVIEIEDVWKTFRLGQGSGTLISKIRSVLTPGHKPRILEALKGVTVRVTRGDKVGIIGTNGSGKTTLMRIIAGIYRPGRGRVTVKGSIASLLQLGIGTIGRLSVGENIFLYGAIMGLTRREIQKRYRKILEFSELEEFEDSQVNHLSTGMNQRLTFSVAVQVDADILLMDEVLAVGDQHFKNKCYDFFQEKLAPDKTMLFCSHDLKEIERFCPKTIWLDKGALAAFGETSEILRRYKETEGYPLEETGEEKKPADPGVVSAG